jgi:hypothetical protein
MSPMLAKSPDSTEVKSLDLPLIGAVTKGQATVKPLEAGWILPLIGKAIDRTMQRKEAALLLGIDHGQMTRQLSGDGHLSALRLGALPQEFWIALMDELRAHYKLDDPAERVKQAMELISRGVTALVTEAQKR